MIKNLKRIVFTILRINVYYFSFLIPKNNNLFVFGSWFGEKYADNSKYLFEYVNNNHPNIEAIWLTNNKKVYDLVIAKGYKCHYIQSIKGYWLSMRAKVGIVSLGKNDINKYASGGLKIIQLWHGSPIKKIGYDDKSLVSIYKKFSIRLKLFPFLREEFNLYMAPSEEVKSKYITAFRVDPSYIKVAGNPRNDAFFIENKNISKLEAYIDKKKQDGFNIVTYLPTHRDEGKIDIADLLLKGLHEINEELKENKIIFLIKFHFTHDKQNEVNNLQSDNIIFVKDEDINQDIYPILKNTNVLVTDYSSVYLDYLLINKPIVFTPFDKEEYIRSRELYYDYDEVTPGPKAKNWGEVIYYIKESISKPDKYLDSREKINSFYNAYRDENNSKRVFKEIMNYISK